MLVLVIIIIIIIIIGRKRTIMEDFMKSRGMEKDMAENRHLWRLGVDGWLLAVQILIIIFANSQEKGK